MNWYSFAPGTWKWGSLKTSLRRAYVSCSTEKQLKHELKHIRKTFTEINKYPYCVITKGLKISK